MCNGVHRLVEQQACATPDAVAIVDGPRLTTYRELNQWANALARELSASGLRRGALTFARMPRSTELAVALLAILKAGASYAWTTPGARDDLGLPAGFCVRCRTGLHEDKYLAVDIDCALRETASRVGPNLPVLTRGPDIACVLLDVKGKPNVLVPHATIAALPRARTLRHSWEGDAGAFDLWLALMSGATLTVGIASPATVAA